MKRKIMTLALVVFFLGSGYTAFAQGSDPSIEFADIPGNGDSIKPFKLGKTEITNQQYVDFLNAALLKNFITVGPVENAARQMILDKDGNQMVNILGYRVVRDHDQNGVYELLEMENPLNRSWVEYDSRKNRFSVPDPNKVNWNHYFDKASFPNVVDKITNWHELRKFWPEGEKDSQSILAGPLDSDHELPSLEEVKRWPVNHMKYYGAKAFADFYGYDLPALEELQWAAAGGKGYKYGTSDGTISSDNVVCKCLPDGTKFTRGMPPHKGHVQPVGTFASNPYGVYDLSGNVYEWTKTLNNKDLNCRSKKSEGEESFVRIGGSWNYPARFQSLETRQCKDTSVARGNDHFGFRVVKRTNK